MPHDQVPSLRRCRQSLEPPLVIVLAPIRLPEVRGHISHCSPGGPDFCSRFV